MAFTDADSVTATSVAVAASLAVRVTAMNDELKVSVGVSNTKVWVRVGVSVTVRSGAGDAVPAGLQLKDTDQDWEGVARRDSVAGREDVGVGEAEGVGLGRGPGDRERVAEGVRVGSGVADPGPDAVAVAVAARGAVPDGVGERVRVRVRAGVAVGVRVRDAVAEGTGVAVPDAERAAEGEGDRARVGEAVAEREGDAASEREGEGEGGEGVAVGVREAVEGLHEAVGVSVAQGVAERLRVGVGWRDRDGGERLPVGDQVRVPRGVTLRVRLGRGLRVPVPLPLPVAEGAAPAEAEREAEAVAVPEGARRADGLRVQDGLADSVRDAVREAVGGRAAVAEAVAVRVAVREAVGLAVEADGEGVPLRDGRGSRVRVGDSVWEKVGVAEGDLRNAEAVVCRGAPSGSQTVPRCGAVHKWCHSTGGRSSSVHAPQPQSLTDASQLLPPCPNTGQVWVQGAKMQKHGVTMFGQSRATARHVLRIPYTSAYVCNADTIHVADVS